MSSLLAGAVWSASSNVSIDVLRKLVYAMDVHKCQLRRVLRVGGQNGAGRVRKVGGVVSNGAGLVMAKMRSPFLVLLLKSKKLIKEHQRMGISGIMDG